jgi:hypothetical protein
MRRIFPAPEALRRLALIPAHLKFINPKIALVRIKIPSKTMPVDVLIEDIALKDGASQGQPFPGIYGHA